MLDSAENSFGWIAFVLCKMDYETKAKHLKAMGTICAKAEFAIVAANVMGVMPITA